MMREFAVLPYRLFAVVVIAIFASSHSSADEWKKAVEYYEGKGGSLKLDDFFPEPVPDDQNFAAIDILRGITIPDGVKHASGIDGEKVREQAGKFKSTLLDKMFEDGSTEYPRLAKGPLNFTPIDLSLWADLDKNGREAYKADLFRPMLAKKILKNLDSELGKHFEQMDAALDRPHSIYAPSYLEFFDRLVPSLNYFPHSTAVIALTEICGLRAVAAVYSDQPDVALKSIRAMLRIIEAESQCSPNLLKFLVFNTCFAYVTKSTWEGLYKRSFDDETLTLLQRKFGETDAFKQFAWSVRGEASYLSLMDYEDLDAARAKTLEAMSLLLKELDEPGIEKGEGLDKDLMPSDLFTKEQFDAARAYSLRTYYDQVIVPLERGNAAALLKSTGELKRMSRELDADEKAIAADPMLEAKKMMFILEGISRNAIILQAQLVFIETSCALERYYLKHKSYPKDLTALVPDYLDELPLDPLDQKTLRYQLTDDGRYQLHSIGFDMIDSGGKVRARLVHDFEIKEEDKDKGDWVWSYSKAEDPDS